MAKALSDNVATIDVEMRSNRAPVRNKSLERFQSILHNRSDELVKLLGSRADTESQTSDVDMTWSRLFDSAHEACILQVSILESKQATAGIHLIENKNRVHISVIQKIVELANQNERLPNSALLERCFQCFGGSRLMRKYFGMCYMQILQMYVLPCPKGINSTTTIANQWDNASLEDVKINEWSRKFILCVLLILFFFKLISQYSFRTLIVLFYNVRHAAASNINNIKMFDTDCV